LLAWFACIAAIRLGTFTAGSVQNGLSLPSIFILFLSPMFAAAKDAMASKAAQSYLNNLIARYGTVQELKIDSRAKTLAAVCLLNGERTPITVRADRYVIERAGDKTFVRVESCYCDRPWIQNLLSDFAKDRRIELPSWAAAAL
jgi:hypothetical protein